MAKKKTKILKPLEQRVTRQQQQSLTLFRNSSECTETEGDGDSTSLHPSQASPIVLDATPPILPSIDVRNSSTSSISSLHSRSNSLSKPRRPTSHVVENGNGHVDYKNERVEAQITALLNSVGVAKVESNVVNSIHKYICNQNISLEKVEKTIKLLTDLVTDRFLQIVKEERLNYTSSIKHQIIDVEEDSNSSLLKSSNSSPTSVSTSQSSPSTSNSSVKPKRPYNRRKAPIPPSANANSSPMEIEVPSIDTNQRTTRRASSKGKPQSDVPPAAGVNKPPQPETDSIMEAFQLRTPICSDYKDYPACITAKPSTKKASKGCGDNPLCLHSLGIGQKGIWDKDLYGKVLGADPGAITRHSVVPYAGLTNLGGTCYMNSLLQTFFMNPAIRSTILNSFSSMLEKESMDSEYMTSTDIQSAKFLDSFMKVFAYLQFGSTSVVSTTDLVAALNVDPEEQQDIHEFYLLLLDNLQSQLSQAGLDHASKLWENLFTGERQIIKQCSNCGETSQRAENFSDLQLTIGKGIDNLTDALRSLSNNERMDGDNQIYCGTCKKKCDMNNHAQLVKLPPVLNLLLTRFQFDPAKNSRKKITDSVFVPNKLDMSDYVTKSNGIPSSLEYELNCVLLHKGSSAESGHYIAVIRDDNNIWWSFDDRKVTRVGDTFYGVDMGASKDDSGRLAETNDESALLQQSEGDREVIDVDAEMGGDTTDDVEMLAGPRGVETRSEDTKKRRRTSQTYLNYTTPKKKSKPSNPQNKSRSSANRQKPPKNSRPANANPDGFKSREAYMLIYMSKQERPTLPELSIKTFSMRFKEMIEAYNRRFAENVKTYAEIKAQMDDLIGSRKKLLEQIIPILAVDVLEEENEKMTVQALSGRNSRVVPTCWLQRLLVGFTDFSSFAVPDVTPNAANAAQQLVISSPTGANHSRASPSSLHQPLTDDEVEVIDDSSEPFDKKKLQHRFQILTEQLATFSNIRDEMESNFCPHHQLSPEKKDAIKIISEESWKKIVEFFQFNDNSKVIDSPDGWPLTILCKECVLINSQSTKSMKDLKDLWTNMHEFALKFDANEVDQTPNDSCWLSKAWLKSLGKRVQVKNFLKTTKKQPQDILNDLGHPYSSLTCPHGVLASLNEKSNELICISLDHWKALSEFKYKYSDIPQLHNLDPLCESCSKEAEAQAAIISERQEARNALLEWSLSYENFPSFFEPIKNVNTTYYLVPHVTRQKLHRYLEGLSNDLPVFDIGLLRCLHNYLQFEPKPLVSSSGLLTGTPTGVMALVDDRTWDSLKKFEFVAENEIGISIVFSLKDSEDKPVIPHLWPDITYSSNPSLCSLCTPNALSLLPNNPLLPAFTDGHISVQIQTTDSTPKHVKSCVPPNVSPEDFKPKTFSKRGFQSTLEIDQVSSSDSVYTVSMKIFQKADYGPLCQILYYEGVYLENDEKHTLQSYMIPNNATLSLYLCDKEDVDHMQTILASQGSASRGKAFQGSILNNFSSPKPPAVSPKFVNVQSSPEPKVKLENPEALPATERLLEEALPIIKKEPDSPTSAKPGSYTSSTIFLISEPASSIPISITKEQSNSPICIPLSSDLMANHSPTEPDQIPLNLELLDQKLGAVSGTEEPEEGPSSLFPDINPGVPFSPPLRNRSTPAPPSQHDFIDSSHSNLFVGSTPDDPPPASSDSFPIPDNAGGELSSSADDSNINNSDSMDIDTIESTPPTSTELENNGNLPEQPTASQANLDPPFAPTTLRNDSLST